MGHSGALAPDSDRLLLLPCFAIAERAVEATRVVPTCIDADGRRAYLAIAKRSQTESVNLYSVLVLGSEMYRFSRKLKVRPNVV